GIKNEQWWYCHHGTKNERWWYCHHGTKNERWWHCHHGIRNNLHSIVEYMKMAFACFNFALFNSVFLLL
ncbi:hypothetical protein, partial [Escherichia coli]